MTYIRDLFKTDSKPILSFEFFPPKTQQAEENLYKTLEDLAQADPDFVSVTYGALGSTRHTTKEIVINLSNNNPFPAMAHLTCVGHSRLEIAQLLDEYAEAGVDNLLALSGDPIELESGQKSDFHYAMDLVEMILDHPHDFSIGVAAHPEVHPRSKDRKSDRKHLAEKLELADFAITQFFFYSKYYVELVEELGELGVTKPIIAGVIPVISTETVLRFSKINKVEVNTEFIEQFENTDPQDRSAFGIDYAWNLIQELEAPGIHIYTLNRSTAGLELASRL